MTYVDVVGRSGGLVSMWDPYVSECTDVIRNQRFIIVQGSLKHTGELLNIVNVCAYNDPIERRSLWEELVTLKQSLQGMWVFGGDFNDVREPGERFNSEFVALNAAFFNHFIEIADLVEYQMGGRKFTYHLDNGVHKSKLDQFLLCTDFRAKWLAASVVTLSNVVSDHCPILLSVLAQDFGPTPIRIFNSWLVMPGKVNATKAEKDAVYKEKLAMLEALELQAEERILSPSELVNRAECKKVIMEADRLKVMDLKQRSRIKWAVERDGNTNFFHNIVNANQCSNRINGLMMNGVWETTPPLIKDSICSFFAQKFHDSLAVRPRLTCPYLKQLTEVDAEMLAAPFSLLEIKGAVWDCAGDKAPGPDSINFRFI
ncbi:uncharacterized protein LOC118484726 [Helianthus annuus]|uniref:uncharacterized protein LOC118484726 n=1 Tax=Helianthus annuus TaxID=4232 RepID=UPI0016533BAA|nr:uncharacterized protein LOC118484726 [Helianthus annuus]